MGERHEWKTSSLRLRRKRPETVENRYSGDFTKSGHVKAAAQGSRECLEGRRREEVEETLRGSTEAILRVAPRTRRTRDDQEKERRRGMVADTKENEASSRGFLRQTQTQHRLPRSYYGGQRIYKMASTGDLVIQGSSESRAGDRRSHRFATREERGSRGELTAVRQSSEPPGEDGRGGWRRRVAEPGGLNQEHKGARQEQGGRREAGGGAGGEEVRFRNLRNQEPGTGAVGGEEVRFRNVKMRQKRARPSAGRPKSEVREEPVREAVRRPLSYIETSPSLPSPLLKGLVWQQGSGIFSRWRERFLVLTKDCIRCHKKSSSSCSEYGALLFTLSLVLVSEVRYVERRGYLTLVLEGAGLGRTYFRRTEDLREWGDLIRSCVVKKKDEFGQMKSTDEFWRYREAVTGYTREGDAWLLSRQVPSSAHQHPTRTTTGAGIGAKVEDADSGLDSLQEEVGEKGRGDVGEPVIIQSDEMQEVRLNMRARNAANTRTTRRMKIPDNLSKVTKV